MPISIIPEEGDFSTERLQRPEEIDSGKAGHKRLGIRTLSDEASGINEMSVTKRVVEVTYSFINDTPLLSSFEEIGL